MLYPSVCMSALALVVQTSYDRPPPPPNPAETRAVNIVNWFFTHKVSSPLYDGYGNIIVWAMYTFIFSYFFPPHISLAFALFDSALTFPRKEPTKRNHNSTGACVTHPIYTFSIMYHEARVYKILKRASNFVGRYRNRTRHNWRKQHPNVFVPCFEKFSKIKNPAKIIFARIHQKKAFPRTSSNCYLIGIMTKK